MSTFCWNWLISITWYFINEIINFSFLNVENKPLTCTEHLPIIFKHNSTEHKGFLTNDNIIIMNSSWVGCKEKIHSLFTTVNESYRINYNRSAIILVNQTNNFTYYNISVININKLNFYFTNSFLDTQDVIKMLVDE